MTNENTKLTDQIDEQLKTSSIKSLPWIGEEYESGIRYDRQGNITFGSEDLLGKKILIVANGTYLNDETSVDDASLKLFTRQIVTHYLNKEEIVHGRFFPAIDKSFIGDKVERELSLELWKHVAFYEYLQMPQSTTKATPEKQYQDSLASFLETVEILSPDLIFMLGKKLADQVQIGTGKGRDVIVDGNFIHTNIYISRKGKVIQMLNMASPSSVSFRTEYWHKAISGVYFSDVKANGLTAMGMKNFRKFKELCPLELRGINVLVGANNAGKSTFVKSVVLYLSFLKRWFKGYRYLNFSLPECVDMDITNFGDAKSFFASASQRLILSMTIGKYRYEAVFNGNDRDTLVPVEQMTVIDTTDERERYEFKYTSNDVKLKVILPNVKVNVSALMGIGHHEEAIIDNSSTSNVPLGDKVFNALVNPIGTLGNYISKKVKDWEDNSLNISIDSVRKDIVNGALNKETLKALDSILQSVHDALGEDSYDYKQIDILHQVIAQMLRRRRILTIKTSLPLSANVEDVMELIKNVDANHTDMFSAPIDDVTSQETDYVHLMELSQHRIYSVHDTDDVAKTVTSFCRHFDTPKDYKGSSIRTFLEKWLDKFDIGVGIDWKDMEKESYMFKITQKDGKESFLNTFGMGSIHLIVLLLKIANFILDSDLQDSEGSFTGSKMTVFLEEPEVNLHPKFQSLLADLFLDIYRESNVQLVVETHSEYLIRKIQVILAKNKYLSDREMNECNPFNVYYFDEKNGVYAMEFNTTGTFSNEFGSGFYDEAANLAFDILL